MLTRPAGEEARSWLERSASAIAVRIPDGRIGRVREVSRGKCRVRVRRANIATHQFLMFAAADLKRVDGPKGWMSPEGYVRYLEGMAPGMDGIENRLSFEVLR